MRILASARRGRSGRKGGSEEEGQAGVRVHARQGARPWRGRCDLHPTWTPRAQANAHRHRAAASKAGASRDGPASSKSLRDRSCHPCRGTAAGQRRTRHAAAIARLNVGLVLAVPVAARGAGRRHSVQETCVSGGENEARLTRGPAAGTTSREPVSQRTTWPDGDPSWRRRGAGRTAQGADGERRRRRRAVGETSARGGLPCLRVIHWARRTWPHKHTARRQTGTHGCEWRMDAPGTAPDGGGRANSAHTPDIGVQTRECVESPISAHPRARLAPLGTRACASTTRRQPCRCLSHPPASTAQSPGGHVASEPPSRR